MDDCHPSDIDNSSNKFVSRLNKSSSDFHINVSEYSKLPILYRLSWSVAKCQEFPSLREYAMVFGINKEVLNGLKKEITIMHPGPINRGVELSSDVADSKHAIILDQVENGVAIRMAVLYLIAGRIKNN